MVNTKKFLVILFFASNLVLSACAPVKSSSTTELEKTASGSTDEQHYQSMNASTTQTISFTNSQQTEQQRTSGDRFCRKRLNQSVVCWMLLSTGTIAQQSYNASIATVYGVYIQGIVGADNIQEVKVMSAGNLLALCRKKQAVYPGAIATYECFTRMLYL
jgi:hypothetical protein